MFKGFFAALLAATIVGCASGAGNTHQEPFGNYSLNSDDRGDGVDTKVVEMARDNLFCASMYISVIRPCINIAAHKRTAKEINEERAPIAEKFGISVDSLGQVTPSDIGSMCVGKATGGAFGNPHAVSNAISGTAMLPSENKPDKVYDWAEDSLSEEVQSILDRIYATPDVDAPDWLERPIGRAVGHINHGKKLLSRAGLDRSEIAETLEEYDIEGSNELGAVNSAEGDVEENIQACLGLL